MLPAMHPFRTITFVAILVALGACAATPEQRAAEAERDFGPICDKKGLARGSEQWRACVETESLNDALAKQRAYDREAVRKRDCAVGPLFPCDPAPPGAGTR